MITAVTLNSIMQFAFTICLMFTIGDLDKVENTPTGLPIIEVYYQATKSKPATNLLVVMIALILVISLFNIFASVSRLTWAFARDKGLPFSNFFSYVSTHVHQWLLFGDPLNSVQQLHPKMEIPLNALNLVGVICALLAIINIGSTTAFNALVSLPLIALYISYFIPILFILIRKLQGRHPQYGPFKLGHWGIPINLFAVLYILFVLSFVALPTIKPVTAANMNYAGPLVLAVIIIALADWVISGRKRFRVPVSRALAGE